MTTKHQHPKPASGLEERMRAERLHTGLHVLRLIEEVRRSGVPVEVYGVKIQECSSRGRTSTDRALDDAVSALDRIRELNQAFFDEFVTWGGCDIDTPGFCRRCVLVGHYHKVRRALNGDTK